MNAILPLILLLALVGCESSQSVMTSDLDDSRDEAIAYVNANFHTDYHREIPVKWGELSCYWSNGIIEIDEKLKGDEDAIQSHMRHEVFHAVTGLADGSAREYNGVVIASKIAWVNQ
jgi:hypothetical protein